MDEVYGRVAQTTDHQGKLPCDVCAKSGQDNSASGFCRNCNEFLCGTCILHHNKFAALTDHLVLQGEDMPIQRPAIVDVEKCSQHPDRPLEMYCKDEDILGCALCFFGHKTCQNVDMISKQLDDKQFTNEIEEIQRASTKQKELSNKSMERIVKFRLTNEQYHAKCLEDFQSFRSEIETTLDRLEKEVLHQADKLKKENTEQLDSLANSILSYEQQIESCMGYIDGRLVLNQKHDDQLFIAVKKYKKQITDAVLKLEQLAEDIHIMVFDFNYEPSIKLSLETDCKIRVNDETTSSTKYIDGSKESTSSPDEKFSTLDIKVSDVQHVSVKSNDDKKDAAHATMSTDGSQEYPKLPKEKKTKPVTKCTDVSKIYIKTKDDKNRCWVGSMVAISETLIILTDYNNNCLKLVDVGSDSVIKRKVLGVQPCGITTIPGSRVAVTVPHVNQIQIFRANQNLDPCGKLTVAPNSRSLSCTGNNIFVSYINPAMVQILDLDGRVLQSIQHNTSGDVLSNIPCFIAVSADSKIYVNNYDSDTLTCVDKTGVVHWVYKDEKLQGPSGVVSGDGCIYICSRNTHTIHVVSPDGVRLAVFPLNMSKKKVHYPGAVVYISHNRTLHVSSDSDDPNHNNYLTKLRMQ